MNKNKKTVLKVLGLATLLLVGLLSARAQTDNTYVHSGAKMHVFGTERMSVWGNSTNFGTWGSEENARVWFYGATWTNDNSATMPGAGEFYFQQPRPAPYANNASQQLEGGHDWTGSTGCSFPDITLENANDLYLINDDSKVRDTFNFVDGHVIHDKMDFTVGDNDPGEILNYNETQFFVTNGDPTDTEGFLEREGMQNSDGTEDFPIGISVGDYTPGNILQAGTQDDMSMRVFLNVYQDGRSGAVLNDSSVARTWDVEERTTGGSNVTMELQHNTATEGSAFTAMRNKHYITHFVGTAPNGPGSNGVDTTSGSKWDLLTFARLNAGQPGNGYITTGTVIGNAVVTRRTGLTDFSPYTKTIYAFIPLPVSLLHFDAIKVGDHAQLSWATASEVNNSHFEVERSLNGKDFTKIGKVQGQGTNHSIQEYQYEDPLGRLPKGSVYYRLKQVDFDGKYEYTPIRFITLDGEAALSNVLVYPNPATNSLNVKVQGVEKYQYQITNSLGQKIQVGENSNHEAIETNRLAKGLYYLNLYSKSRLLNRVSVLIQ